jgi:hypothetical protein
MHPRQPHRHLAGVSGRRSGASRSEEWHSTTSKAPSNAQSRSRSSAGRCRFVPENRSSSQTNSSCPDGTWFAAERSQLETRGEGRAERRQTPYEISENPGAPVPCHSGRGPSLFDLGLVEHQEPSHVDRGKHQNRQQDGLKLERQKINPEIFEPMRVQRHKQDNRVQDDRKPCSQY